jgi:catechol 2,3-dioxygenase-like lactoylglutathione lyase family enzyme
MRLDHIAYRVADRWKTAEFFQKVFGYRIAEDLPEGFDIQFEDETWAKCLVLLPPEKKNFKLQMFIQHHTPNMGFLLPQESTPTFEYHLAPEIFISDGSTGSIVKEWVEKRDGIGGIHHLAYQVNSVEKKMEEMKNLGYFEFTTEEPLKCEGLTQVFTKPSQLTGTIYEFIERGIHGFCKDNVKDLMKSTKNI